MLETRSSARWGARSTKSARFSSTFWGGSRRMRSIAQSIGSACSGKDFYFEASVALQCVNEILTIALSAFGLRSWESRDEGRMGPRQA